MRIVTEKMQFYLAKKVAVVKYLRDRDDISTRNDAINQKVN